MAVPILCVTKTLSITIKLDKIHLLESSLIDSSFWTYGINIL